MPVTTGTTGISIASRSRSSVEFQELVLAGAGSKTIGYYTVTTTPTLWVAVNATRRVMILQNRSAVSVFAGSGAVIDVATAPYIAAGDTLEWDCIDSLWLTVASGTAVVSFIELVN